ncbi:MAG: HAD hydrolase family protein, partial [Clostridia bacterium]|nr:HAD hydrolase family protein [Clostridia bacterium]
MGRYDGILIVSDFDRTMTDETGAVPERNREAIARFMAEGGRFTVATGRSVPMFRKKNALFESNAPAIAFNGGA